MTTALDRMIGHVNHAVVSAWGRQITYARGAVSLAITVPMFSAGQAIMEGGDGTPMVVRVPQARVRVSDLGALGEPRRNDVLTIADGESAGTYQVTEMEPDGTGLQVLTLRRVA